MKSRRTYKDFLTKKFKDAASLFKLILKLDLVNLIQNLKIKIFKNLPNP